MPDVLRQWGIDITTIKGPASNVTVWDFTVTILFPARHKYVHRYESVSPETAAGAVKCVRAFREQIVGAVANEMGLTLDATGQWCEIFRPAREKDGVVVQPERIDKYPSAVLRGLRDD